MGASAKADRATRPTDQAPAGLGDTASVPSADNYASLVDALRAYANALARATAECERDAVEDGRHRNVTLTPASATRLEIAMRVAANELTARDDGAGDA